MKKGFHLNLFREGLRQLSLSGWMFFAICSIEAILVPMSYSQNKSVGAYAQVISPVEAHWVLLLTILIAAPILAVTMFSFLNSRNASDFYHALPYTRQSLFFSFYLAVAAWLAVIIFGSTLVSTVMNLAFARTLSLNFGGLWMLAFKCFLSSLLVAAVIALAMSVTGTLFNNLIVAALILVFPRLFLMVIPLSVNSILPMCTDDSLPFLLSPFCNIIFQTFCDAFNGITEGWNMVSNGSAIAYSVVLLLVYLALGCWLFMRRKSEASAAAAPSRLMQAVFRIALTTAYTFMVTALLYSDSFGEDSFFYFILYVIGVVIYCVYELITTHKFSKLLHALPGLGIVVALNFLLLAGLNLFSMAELSYNPKAEKISAISVRQNVYSYSTSLGNYALRVGSKAKITDETLIAAVAEQLQEANSVYRANHSDEEYDKAFRDCYDITLRICSDGIWHTRRVPLTAEQNELLLKALNENETVREAWMNLPEPIVHTISTPFGSLDEENDAKLRKLFDTLQAEIKEIGFENWYRFCQSMSDYGKDQLGFLYYSYYYNGETCNMSIPLDLSVLPKTCAMCIKMTAQSKYNYTLSETLDELQKTFPQIFDPENPVVPDYCYICWDLRLKQDGEYITVSFNGDLFDKTVLELRQYLAMTEADTVKGDCLQYISGYFDISVDGEEYYYGESFFAPLGHWASIEHMPYDLQEFIKPYIVKTEEAVFYD